MHHKMISLPVSRFSCLIAVMISSFFTLELPIIAQERDKDASPQQIEEITAKSLMLLQNIEPHGKSEKPLKMLETQGGVIRWGNLFDRNEIVALVNLAPEKSTEPFDYPPQYLSFFVWEKKSLWSKGKWTFRQFLDNASDLEIHHRKDKPSHFLQGSRQTGRYEGVHLSWYYDEATKKLIPTGFEDWGPFYLVGDYLVCTRGFERLHHEDSRKIYQYRNGKKGKQIASWWEKDNGHFSFDYKDTKTGKAKGWHFEPKDESESQYIVYSNEKSAEITIEGNGWGQSYFFELLTGLSSELLDEKWRDELPKHPPLKRIAIKATGDPEIVKRLQWPPKGDKVTE